MEARSIGVPSLPELQSLLLVLTAQCNLRCSYCYQTAKNERTMHWATLRAAIDFAMDSSAGAVELMFIGGEPLIEWASLRRAVHYAEARSGPARRVRCAISTNGLLITDEVAAFLSEHEVRIQLSFDGTREAQNLRHPETFAALDCLLDRLRNRHVDLFENRLRVHITLAPQAVPRLAESYQYLVDKGVRAIAVTPCLIRGSNSSCACREELDRQFSKMRDMSLALLRHDGDVPLLLFRNTKALNHPRRNGRPMCGVTGGRALVIDVDGTMHGCPMLADCYQEFPSDFLRRHLGLLGMGDFREADIEARRARFREAAGKAGIFHNKEKKYSSFRKCGTCEYFEDCSVCPVSIGYDPENADPHRVPDFMCAFNMAALKYRESFPPLPDPIEKLESLLAMAEKAKMQP